MGSSDDEPLRELARGFRQRTLVTAKLAAKMGARYAKAQLGMSGTSTGEAAIRSAEELVREMGKLKGLVMKMGQIASYMPGAMSPEAQRVLARLQAQSTRMAGDVVRARIREELGAEPEALFDRFDATPCAAASIGQVHRASLGGRELAVKVQYPDIEALVRSDLDTIQTIARVSTIGMNMDSRALAEELRARVLEECDYRLEGASQALFAEIWSHRPGWRVPGVVAERTGKTVLTTEWIDALDFHRFADTASQEVRDRAGMHLFEACFETVFERCIYNADPHPGNYLFHPDGSVTFLDFGCVRSFDPSMIATWKRLARATLGGDQPRFREAFVDLGLAPRGKSFDWDHQWSMMQYLYRPFLAKEPFRYTQDYVRESYASMLVDNPNRMRAGMPPEWLLLNRLQWGLNSVLALLGASAVWGDVVRRVVEAPERPARAPSPSRAPA